MFSLTRMFRGPARWSAATRRTLVRHPWVYWAVVVALGAFVWSALDAQRSAAEQARNNWSDAVAVVVARSDLRPGDRLTASASLQEVPLSVRPPSAVDALDGVVRQYVDAGSIVTTADVEISDSTLARVPSGWLTVTIRESPPSGAEIGDRVVVASEGIAVASEALVVATDGELITLAVSADEAPTVAFASGTGRATVMRSPAPFLSVSP